MIERALIALLLIAAGGAAWIAFNRFSLRRLAGRAPSDPLLADLLPGQPAILYFTTPFCEPCRTLQKPALQKLRDEFGPALQVLEIDATERPDDADRWGVFSAPTTFVLDRRLLPVHVNRGVASAESLRKQLTEAA